MNERDGGAPGASPGKQLGAAAGAVPGLVRGGGRIVRLPAGSGVSAWLLADGALHLYGQDRTTSSDPRSPPVEYEFSFTVRRADLPLLLRALGAAPDADVLDSVAALGARMVEPGLGRWLWRAGIEPLFWHTLTGP